MKWGRFKVLFFWLSFAIAFVAKLKLKESKLSFLYQFSKLMYSHSHYLMPSHRSQIINLIFIILLSILIFGAVSLQTLLLQKHHLHFWAQTKQNFWRLSLHYFRRYNLDNSYNWNYRNSYDKFDINAQSHHPW